MNSKLSSIFEIIVNNSELINEFFKIESKDSMYKFFLKISSNLSREEFEKYINTLEIASYEKQALDSDNLEKIAGGLNKKNWTTMLSSSLIPLMSIGAVYPVGAVNVKNDILYKYVSENKSTIKKVATIGTPIALSVLTLGGGILLINHLVANRLSDFEKLENPIINLSKELANEKTKEFKEYIKLINRKLEIKLKKLNINTTTLTSKSGILIFNEQILKIVKDDSEYFKKDISRVVGLLDYLTKNAVKPPYRGLSNAGCYCYLNSAVQMLSADDELCDILGSDKEMKKCFENFKTYKDSVIEKKYEILNNDIENFEHDAKAKYHAIVDMITNNLSKGILNEHLPNEVVSVITSKEKHFGKFYDRLFRKVDYDNSDNRWVMYNPKSQNQITSDVSSVVCNLFSSNDLKDGFNNLTNEYLKMYDDLFNNQEYMDKRNERGSLDGLKNRKEYNDYEFATSSFKSHINKDFNVKLLDMMHFVNAKTDADTTSFGGKNLADVLKQRDMLDNKGLDGWNWYEQNDAGEAILRGFNIPDFIVDTVNCGFENNGFDPANVLKKHVSCGAYVLVLSTRGLTPNPHSVDMNLSESVTTDDGSEYKLISFACHSGSTRAGHWWAVRKDKSGNWWECNDSNVSNAGNSEECLNNNRYKKGASVLLYKKIK